MSGMARSRVVARTARVDDLPTVLALVRQYRADAHAEGVLTGQTALGAAAAGFRRLLADAAHRVDLAVLPGSNAASCTSLDPAGSENAVGLALLGIDPLSLVLGAPQVPGESFVVHRAHRRLGVGSALLGAAVAFAAENGAAHVVASVGGHEAERQRFLAQMGFAPLTARRVVAVEGLARTLAARQRAGVTVPAPRRPASRRRTLPTVPVPRPLPMTAAVADG